MTTFEEVLQARRNPVRLNEASLSRVYQHVQKAGDKGFGIVTSWRAGKVKAQNLRDFKKLKGEVRSMGLGFFKLIGNWRECQDPDVAYDDCPESELESSKEPALFIPGIDQAQIKQLMKKYSQDAVVYAGPETKGDVVLLLRGGSPTKIGKFSPGRIAQAYSRVRGRAFAFEGFEYPAQSWAEKLIEQSLGHVA
jgi:hypothetical protein